MYFAGPTRRGRLLFFHVRKPLAATTTLRGCKAQAPLTVPLLNAMRRPAGDKVDRIPDPKSKSASKALEGQGGAFVEDSFFLDASPGLAPIHESGQPAGITGLGPVDPSAED